MFAEFVIVDKKSVNDSNTEKTEENILIQC